MPTVYCAEEITDRLYVGFGRTENLLDVLMQDANYCDDGYIADIYNSAKLWISMRSAKLGYCI